MVLNGLRAVSLQSENFQFISLLFLWLWMKMMWCDHNHIVTTIYSPVNWIYFYHFGKTAEQKHCNVNLNKTWNDIQVTGDFFLLIRKKWKACEIFRCHVLIACDSYWQLASGFSILALEDSVVIYTSAKMNDTAER